MGEHKLKNRLNKYIKEAFITFTSGCFLYEHNMLTQENILSLYQYSSSVFDFLCSDATFKKLYDKLCSVYGMMNNNILSSRDLQILYKLMNALCNIYASKLKYVFAGDEKLLQKYHAVTIKNQKVDENIVKVLLTENQDEESDADFVITPDDVKNAALKCWPIQELHTYSRIQLQGKLKRLDWESCPETLIVGPSFGCDGLLEKEMPGVSINQSTGSLDFYYTILLAKHAVYQKPSIKNIVIPMSYYMAFYDIACFSQGNANCPERSFQANVLSKVLVPVLNDVHGYTGRLLPTYDKTDKNPLFRYAFNLESVRDDLFSDLSDKLAYLEYYNEYYPRESKGIASENASQAEIDRSIHEATIACGWINPFKDYILLGKRNASYFDDFLKFTDSKNINVLFFIYPASSFLRSIIDGQIKENFNEIILPVIRKHPSCIYYDLYSSNLFNNSDFRNYDHTNQKGAEKLTRWVAERINEINEGKTEF